MGSAKVHVDRLVAAGGMLGILVILLAQTGCERPSQGNNTPVLAEVGVVEARSQTVPEIVDPNGKTRALSEVSVRARVRGVLQKMHFKEGQEVHGPDPAKNFPGDLLFEIDKAPFEAKLGAAQAKLAEYEAELVQANRSQAREIAASQVAVDQAVFNLNEVEEARQRALLKRGAAAPEDVDRAIASSDRSAAQVESDKAKLEQSKVDYDVQIKMAEAHVQSAKEEVRQAELDLSYCTIYAEIDGRIGEAKVKPGNLVGPMSGTLSADFTELATIQQLRPMMGVDIQCPSRYLELATRLIDQGLKVSLVRPGAETEEPRVYHGRAFFIDNKIDPKTSTVLIKAAVENPDNSLLPGEYVKLEMVTREIPDAVLVPERAVQETQEGATVYVVNDKDVVEAVPVESTYRFERQRVITSGLDAGKRVIVDGIQLVRPGQTVKPRPAPWQPEDAQTTEAAAESHATESQTKPKAE